MHPKYKFLNGCYNVAMDETVKEPQEESPEELRRQRRMLAAGLEKALKAIKELEEFNLTLTKELHEDPLTGLSNQRAFEEKFGKFVDEAHENDEPLALLVADVDGMKLVNDKLGHPMGDRLLQAVGEAFKKVARPTDMIGRLGGDEFYAVLPGYLPLDEQDPEDLYKTTMARYQDAFREAIAGLDLPEELRARVKVSFGIATLQPYESAEMLYKRADAAAYDNKQKTYAELGRKGIAIAPDPRTQI